MRSVGLWFLLIGVVPAAVALPASAQDNLDRGKSPQQLFNTNCAICHASVRGLGASIRPRSLSGFLIEHYTTSRAGANALAAYLTAAGGGDRKQRPQRRRPKASEKRK